MYKMGITQDKNTRIIIHMP